MILVVESSLRHHNFPAETLVSSSSLSKLCRLVIHPVQRIKPSLHKRPRPRNVSEKPKVIKSGRGDRIRTYDLLVPNQALYQAKLHPGARFQALTFTQYALRRRGGKQKRESLFPGILRKPMGRLLSCVSMSLWRLAPALCP